MEGLDDLIEADWNTNRKRFVLNQDQCGVLYDLINKLEEEHNIPPTWLKVRQQLRKVTIPCLEEIKNHPFLKTGLYYDDKLYADEELNYCSLKKYNDHFLTFT